MLLDVSRVFGNLAYDGDVFGGKARGFVVGKQGFHLEGVVDELCLVAYRHRHYVVHYQVAEHAGFNLYFLCVGFVFNLVACFEFLFGHYIHAFEHSHAFGSEVTVEDERAARLAVEPAARRFGFPFLAVSVAVKAYGFAFLDVFAQYLDYGLHFRFAGFY